MTIAGYASNDKISLASGSIVKSNSYDESTRDFKLTIVDSKGEDSTITVEDVTEDSLTSVKVNINGIDKTINIPYPVSEQLLFDNETDHASATKVSVTTAFSSSDFADFGVISADSIDSGNNPSLRGAEYYTALVNINVDKDNAVVLGNAKANTFNVSGGGESNIITGGIGKDTFIFENSGGVITDFGVGTTKSGENKVLATTTKRTGTSTYVEFNRDDPTSYAQGADILKVNGTVVEIAFDKDSATNISNKKNTFTAYVTYDVDGNSTTIDDIHTIALANITKKATKTDKAGKGANAVYDSNDTAAAKLNIWDTSSDGVTSKQLTLSTTSELFKDKDESQYLNNNISELDELITTKQITTYDDPSDSTKVTGVTNGVAFAYTNKKNNG